MVAVLNFFLLFNLIFMAFSPTTESASSLFSPQQASPPAQLNIAETVFSTTGVFSIPLPEGDWMEFYNGYDRLLNRADIILTSAQELAIVHAYMLFELGAVDLQDLNDNFYTSDYFRREWSSYERVDIVRRKIEEPLLRIDFYLIDNGDNYAGRQISWLDSGHIFNIRLVVPLLHIGLLGDLQALFIEKFTFYPNMLDTPLTNMQLVTSDTVDVMVKLPDDWERIGPSDSDIVAYTGEGDILMLMFHRDDDIDLSDREAVRDWILASNETLTVLDIQPIEQAFGSGYWLSYTIIAEDDAAISAVLVVFPAYDGGVSVVQVSLESPDKNLLDEDENPLARQVLESVTLLAPDDFVNIER